ncbi:MAG: creatininase family protein [Saprospiraceae bacterium]|nr:creatininase family protein [Saprospiraceae bacterium]
MDFEQYRLERQIPERIYAALKEKSIIYLPLGAIEWHGLHLPIGLDSLTSHGICLRAAEKAGGLVMPPLYYGMTGSIGHHPWTILLEEENTFLAILRDTLRRLEAFDVELAVIFTGHFGRRQLAALDQLQREWSDENHEMKLITLSINQCPNAKMMGDHGAIFETSILSQLHPDMIHLNKLPGLEKHPANDPNGDSWGPHRRDPDNILFGVLGDDPRDYDQQKAEELYRTILQWVVDTVKKAYS